MAINAESLKKAINETHPDWSEETKQRWIDSQLNAMTESDRNEGSEYAYQEWKRDYNGPERNSVGGFIDRVAWQGNKFSDLLSNEAHNTFKEGSIGDTVLGIGADILGGAVRAIETSPKVVKDSVNVLFGDAEFGFGNISDRYKEAREQGLNKIGAAAQAITEGIHEDNIGGNNKNVASQWVDQVINNPAVMGLVGNVIKSIGKGVKWLGRASKTTKVTGHIDDVVKTTDKVVTGATNIADDTAKVSKGGFWKTVKEGTKKTKEAISNTKTKIVDKLANNKLINNAVTNNKVTRRFGRTTKELAKGTIPGAHPLYDLIINPGKALIRGAVQGYKSGGIRGAVRQGLGDVISHGLDTAAEFISSPYSYRLPRIWGYETSQKFWGNMAEAYERSDDLQDFKDKHGYSLNNVLAQKNQAELDNWYDKNNIPEKDRISLAEAREEAGNVGGSFLNNLLSGIHDTLAFMDPWSYNENFYESTKALETGQRTTVETTPRGRIRTSGGLTIDISDGTITDDNGKKINIEDLSKEQQEDVIASIIKLDEGDYSELVTEAEVDAANNQINVTGLTQNNDISKTIEGMAQNGFLTKGATQNLLEGNKSRDAVYISTQLNEASKQYVKQIVALYTPAELNNNPSKQAELLEHFSAMQRLYNETANIINKSSEEEYGSTKDVYRFREAMLEALSNLSDRDQELIDSNLYQQAIDYNNSLEEGFNETYMGWASNVKRWINEKIVDSVLRPESSEYWDSLGLHGLGDTAVNPEVVGAATMLGDVRSAVAENADYLIAMSVVNFLNNNVMERYLGKALYDFGGQKLMSPKLMASKGYNFGRGAWTEMWSEPFENFLDAISMVEDPSTDYNYMPGLMIGVLQAGIAGYASSKSNYSTINDYFSDPNNRIEIMNRMGIDINQIKDGQKKAVVLAVMNQTFDNIIGVMKKAYSEANYGVESLAQATAITLINQDMADYATDILNQAMGEINRINESNGGKWTLQQIQDVFGDETNFNKFQKGQTFSFNQSFLEGIRNKEENRTKFSQMEQRAKSLVVTAQTLKSNNLQDVFDKMAPKVDKNGNKINTPLTNEKKDAEQTMYENLDPEAVAVTNYVAASTMLGLNKELKTVGDILGIGKGSIAWDDKKGTFKKTVEITKEDGKKEKISLRDYIIQRINEQEGLTPEQRGFIANMLFKTGALGFNSFFTDSGALSRMGKDFFNSVMPDIAGSKAIPQWQLFITKKVITNITNSTKSRESALKERGSETKKVVGSITIGDVQVDDGGDISGIDQEAQIGNLTKDGEPYRVKHLIRDGSVSWEDDGVIFTLTYENGSIKISKEVQQTTQQQTTQQQTSQQQDTSTGTQGQENNKMDINEFGYMVDDYSDEKFTNTVKQSYDDYSTKEVKSEGRRAERFYEFCEKVDKFINKSDKVIRDRLAFINKKLNDPNTSQGYEWHLMIEQDALNAILGERKKRQEFFDKVGKENADKYYKDQSKENLQMLYDKYYAEEEQTQTENQSQEQTTQEQTTQEQTTQEQTTQEQENTTTTEGQNNNMADGKANVSYSVQDKSEEEVKEDNGDTRESGVILPPEDLPELIGRLNSLKGKLPLWNKKQNQVALKLADDAEGRSKVTLTERTKINGKDLFNMTSEDLNDEKNRSEYEVITIKYDNGTERKFYAVPQLNYEVNSQDVLYDLEGNEIEQPFKATHFNSFVLVDFDNGESIEKVENFIFRGPKEDFGVGKNFIYNVKGADGKPISENRVLNFTKSKDGRWSIATTIQLNRLSNANRQKAYKNGNVFVLYSLRDTDKYGREVIHGRKVQIPGGDEPVFFDSREIYTVSDLLMDEHATDIIVGASLSGEDMTVPIGDKHFSLLESTISQQRNGTVEQMSDEMIAENEELSIITDPTKRKETKEAIKELNKVENKVNEEGEKAVENAQNSTDDPNVSEEESINEQNKSIDPLVYDKARAKLQMIVADAEGFPISDYIDLNLLPTITYRNTYNSTKEEQNKYNNALRQCIKKAIDNNTFDNKQAYDLINALSNLQLKFDYLMQQGGNYLNTYLVITDLIELIINDMVNNGYPFINSGQTEFKDIKGMDIKEFSEKVLHHGYSPIEIGISIDGDGNIIAVIAGTGQSAWKTDGTKTFIHSHPNGGFFSDADILGTINDGLDNVGLILPGGVILKFPVDSMFLSNFTIDGGEITKNNWEKFDGLHRTIFYAIELSLRQGTFDQQEWGDFKPVADAAKLERETNGTIDRNVIISNARNIAFKVFKDISYEVKREALISGNAEGYYVFDKSSTTKFINNSYNKKGHSDTLLSDSIMGMTDLEKDDAAEYLNEWYVSMPNSSFTEIQQKAKAENGIYTLRGNKKNEHFGNPFSFEDTYYEDGTVRTIKVDSAETAVMNYFEWLTGRGFKTLQQDRRKWIIQQIFDGSLKNRKIFYYTDDVTPGWNNGEYSIYGKRGNSRTYSYKQDYNDVGSRAYNHAMVLGMLINNPQYIQVKGRLRSDQSTIDFLKRHEKLNKLQEMEFKNDRMKLFESNKIIGNLTKNTYSKQLFYYLIWNKGSSNVGYYDSEDIVYVTIPDYSQSYFASNDDYKNDVKNCIEASMSQVEAAIKAGAQFITGVHPTNNEIALFEMLKANGYIPTPPKYGHNYLLWKKEGEETNTIYQTNPILESTINEVMTGEEKTVVKSIEENGLPDPNNDMMRGNAEILERYANIFDGTQRAQIVDDLESLGLSLASLDAETLGKFFMAYASGEGLDDVIKMFAKETTQTQADEYLMQILIDNGVLRSNTNYDGYTVEEAVSIQGCVDFIKRLKYGNLNKAQLRNLRNEMYKSDILKEAFPNKEDRIRFIILYTQMQVLQFKKYGPDSTTAQWKKYKTRQIKKINFVLENLYAQFENATKEERQFQIESMRNLIDNTIEEIGVRGGNDISEEHAEALGLRQYYANSQTMTLDQLIDYAKNALGITDEEIEKTIGKVLTINEYITPETICEAITSTDGLYGKRVDFIESLVEHYITNIFHMNYLTASEGFKKKIREAIGKYMDEDHVAIVGDINETDNNKGYEFVKELSSLPDDIRYQMAVEMRRAGLIGQGVYNYLVHIDPTATYLNEGQDRAGGLLTSLVVKLFDKNLLGGIEGIQFGSAEDKLKLFLDIYRFYSLGGNSYRDLVSILEEKYKDANTGMKYLIRLLKLDARNSENGIYPEAVIKKIKERKKQYKANDGKNPYDVFAKNLGDEGSNKKIIVDALSELYFVAQDSFFCIIQYAPADIKKKVAEWMEKSNTKIHGKNIALGMVLSFLSSTRNREILDNIAKENTNKDFVEGSNKEIKDAAREILKNWDDLLLGTNPEITKALFEATGIPGLDLTKGVVLLTDGKEFIPASWESTNGALQFPLKTINDLDAVTADTNVIVLESHVKVPTKLKNKFHFVTIRGGVKNGMLLYNPNGSYKSSSDIVFDVISGLGNVGLDVNIEEGFKFSNEQKIKINNKKTDKGLYREIFRQIVIPVVTDNKQEISRERFEAMIDEDSMMATDGDLIYAAIASKSPEDKINAAIMLINQVTNGQLAFRTNVAGTKKTISMKSAAQQFESKILSLLDKNDPYYERDKKVLTKFFSVYLTALLGVTEGETPKDLLDNGGITEEWLDYIKNRYNPAMSRILELMENAGYAISTWVDTDSSNKEGKSTSQKLMEGLKEELSSDYTKSDQLDNSYDDDIKPLMNKLKSMNFIQKLGFINSNLNNPNLTRSQIRILLREKRKLQSYMEDDKNVNINTEWERYSVNNIENNIDEEYDSGEDEMQEVTSDPEAKIKVNEGDFSDKDAQVFSTLFNLTIADNLVDMGTNDIKYDDEGNNKYISQGVLNFIDDKSLSVISEDVKLEDSDEDYDGSVVNKKSLLALQSILSANRGDSEQMGLILDKIFAVSDQADDDDPMKIKFNNAKEIIIRDPDMFTSVILNLMDDENVGFDVKQVNMIITQVYDQIQLEVFKNELALEIIKNNIPTFNDAELEEARKALLQYFEEFGIPSDDQVKGAQTIIDMYNNRKDMSKIKLVAMPGNAGAGKTTMLVAALKAIQQAEGAYGTDLDRLKNGTQTFISNNFFDKYIPALDLARKNPDKEFYVEIKLNSGKVGYIKFKGSDIVTHDELEEEYRADPEGTVKMYKQESGNFWSDEGILTMLELGEYARGENGKYSKTRYVINVDTYYDSKEELPEGVTVTKEFGEIHALGNNIPIRKDQKGFDPNRKDNVIKGENALKDIYILTKNNATVQNINDKLGKKHGLTGVNFATMNSRTIQQSSAGFSLFGFGDTLEIRADKELEGALILIDESQNTDDATLQAIIDGYGDKNMIVFLGDSNQKSQGKLFEDMINDKKTEKVLLNTLFRGTPNIQAVNKLNALGQKIIIKGKAMVIFPSDSEDFIAYENVEDLFDLPGTTMYSAKENTRVAEINKRFFDRALKNKKPIPTMVIDAVSTIDSSLAKKEMNKRDAEGINLAEYKNIKEDGIDVYVKEDGADVYVFVPTINNTERKSVKAEKVRASKKYKGKNIRITSTAWAVTTSKQSGKTVDNIIMDEGITDPVNDYFVRDNVKEAYDTFTRGDKKVYYRKGAKKILFAPMAQIESLVNDNIPNIELSVQTEDIKTTVQKINMPIFTVAQGDDINKVKEIGFMIQNLIYNGGNRIIGIEKTEQLQDIVDALDSVYYLKSIQNKGLLSTEREMGKADWNKKQAEGNEKMLPALKEDLAVWWNENKDSIKKYIITKAEKEAFDKINGWVYGKTMYIPQIKNGTLFTSTEAANSTLTLDNIVYAYRNLREGRSGKFFEFKKSIDSKGREVRSLVPATLEWRKKTKDGILTFKSKDNRIAETIENRLNKYSNLFTDYRQGKKDAIVEISEMFADDLAGHTQDDDFVRIVDIQKPSAVSVKSKIGKEVLSPTGKVAFVNGEYVNGRQTNNYYIQERIADVFNIKEGNLGEAIRNRLPIREFYATSSDYEYEINNLGERKNNIIKRLMALDITNDLENDLIDFVSTIYDIDYGLTTVGEYESMNGPDTNGSAILSPSYINNMKKGYNKKSFNFSSAMDAVEEEMSC